MTTQKKFIERMVKLAEDLGEEAVVDSAWANTGAIRFQPAGSFETRVTVHYKFFDGYASFDVIGSGGQELIEKPGGVGYCRYDATFEDKVQRIAAVVTEAE